MKVYKFGGNILKDKETRLYIYKKLQDEKEKIVLVVSAFKNTPYSSDSLASLLKDCQDEMLKEKILSLGEIISSLIITNELKNLHVNCALIYPEEIGITISKSNSNLSIAELDNSFILKKLMNHDIIVFPGFIAKNKNFETLTLNSGGSDLSAVLVAKMLNVEEITLYKDVIGVCKCDPHLLNNDELIKNISYDRLLNFCRHGSKIIQLEALKYAKENNIKIRIKHYALDNEGSLVFDKKGDSSIGLNYLKNHVYIDGYSLSDNIKNLLFKNEVEYDLITIINDSIDIKTSYNNEQEILNLVYNLIRRKSWK